MFMADPNFIQTAATIRIALQPFTHDRHRIFEISSGLLALNPILYSFHRSLNASRRR
jgi:hypothetical protein